MNYQLWFANRYCAAHYRWRTSGASSTRMPKITLAKGERQRERVLSVAEASLYLEACTQPWKDAAMVMLGTAFLRPSEVLFPLRWERVHLNGTGGLTSISKGSRGQPGECSRLRCPQSTTR